MAQATSVRPVALPDPVRRPAAAINADLEALERDLAAEVDGEVRFDAGTRGAYSTDASNYRLVPLGMVAPRTVEAGVAAVAVCRRYGVPVVSRGGGTSLAGQATNTAVVIDWSKYCDRLLEVDAEAQTCLVEPGIVLDVLNGKLSDAGLEFGPHPSTHNHCTLGGMIGNDSCGATAQRSGRVSANVIELEVLLYDGTRMWVGETSDEDYERIQREGGRRAEVYRQLRALRDTYADQIQARFPDIPRLVSGYALYNLLPENGFNVARMVVGSEGTLVFVLRARLKLLPRIKEHTLVFLGYPDIAAAADAIPDVVAHHPVALEALDDKLIGFERRKHLNRAAMDDLPPGGAWLMVQLGGATQDEADVAADRMLKALGQSPNQPGVRVFRNLEREREMWEVRESALGATARVPGMPDTWPGWEDAAVSPERLGDYLRDFIRLLREYGLEQTSLYGHFGQGCVHCRIPFDLYTADGIRQFRAFLRQAADLVASYGGSLSGEHGDGQARAELLPRMFGPDLTRAFAQLKAIFDPGNRMNPGKVSQPYPLDSFLRIGVDYNHGEVDTHFRYPDDDGSFSRAVLRCVGVGKCRRQDGGVMCPSYMVTREEEHSTRGRARLLFEMLDGENRGGAIEDGWRSTAVRDALDLCLACKGCKADCPVQVDMATYKAEFLAHHYAGRVRPAAHYAMGWLPVWAGLAAAAPKAVNALSHAPGLSRLAKLAGGIDRRRDLPLFAAQSLQKWSAQRSTPAKAPARGQVVLWPDTFTNNFHPGIGQAAVEVLEEAGWRVHIPAERVCCGLTWISTGQLGMAKRALRRTMRVLRPHLRDGALILGLEPSCTAVFRNDVHDLFGEDDDARRLRELTVTLAELLHDHTPGWQPPRLERRAVVQTHCHQHAVMKAEKDKEVLARAGVEADMLDSGCCGLAGNFGFERGHYEVSRDCAERVMLPAIRGSRTDDVILADGFSCRLQIEQGDAAGRRGVHLAELLRAGLHGDSRDPRPEREWSTPNPMPSKASRVAATAAVTGGVGAAVGLAAWRWLKR